ncbi:hypothetical protein NQ317_001181 [Molorchus minor]|uniref:Uncharacterized protein n=1 Tax=Molorchus minor TaxID=1323400 RepID=A0ABQ9J2X6_9CUCU|nr:hypothetical protein NQ317_001181 [Molorchus minor]
MNSVSHLLKCNFPGLSLEDKIKIKELCRTLPDLKLTLLNVIIGKKKSTQDIIDFSEPGNTT